MRKILGALILACFSTTALAFSGGMVESTGSVYRVIDADTFIVNLDDRNAFEQLVDMAETDNDRLRYLNAQFNSIRIRLANVDTPESVHPDASRNTREGARLSRHIKSKLEGSDVLVRCHDWGYYGRLICNVGMNSSPEANQDLGGYLIRNDFSPYISRWGENPYFHSEYQNYSR